MRTLTAAVAALSVFALAGPAFAQYGADRRAPKNAATPELPQCAKPLGRAAIKEPQNKWWTQYGLGSPEVLIKLFAGRSNCLIIVDRGAGLAMQREEAVRLEAALARLPPLQGDVLRLRYFQGHTLEQVAGKLGVTREAIVWQMQLGLKQLRRWLAEPPPQLPQ